MPRKHSHVTLAFALGLTLLAACGGSDDSSSSETTPATSVVDGYQVLAPADADALLRNPPDGLIIVDVRTPEEFASGHIEGAVEIDLQSASFETDVAGLDPKAPYFVYCRSANRSAQAIAYMQQHGFDTIYELEGGIVAWQTAGLPVVTV